MTIYVDIQVAAHAPLILHVPGLTDRGLRSSELVEFVDIFPTLVNMNIQNDVYIEICDIQGIPKNVLIDQGHNQN